MIILVIIALILLAGLSKYITKSYLFPPGLYAIFWAGLLCLLVLSGDTFYEISIGTLAIYLLGAVMFCVGGLLTLGFSKEKIILKQSMAADRQKFVCRMIDSGLLILLIALPFYIAYLQQISDASGIDNFWIGLRAQTSTGEKVEEASTIFTYLPAWGTFLAFAALHANRQVTERRWRTIMVIVLVIVYQFLTMSRTGLIETVVGLLAIDWIMTGKFNIKVWLILGLIFIIGFSVPAILLDKGGNVDAGIRENIFSIVEMSRLYLLGGLVAFDSVVNNIQFTQSEFLTLRFFISVAKALGADVNVPNLVQEYSMTPLPTNVYTIYFPYYVDFGLVGVISAMFILGVILTYIYRSAVQGNSQAILLYGVTISSLVLSVANETFLTALSFWIQATVFTCILYRTPIRFQRSS